MVIMEPIVKQLKQVRELLVRDGWCQGQFGDDQGRRCLLGACTAAGFPGLTPEGSRIRSALRAALFSLNKRYPANHQTRPGEHVTDLMSFNDAYAKDVRYVLRLIDTAIKQNS